jgi:hypothetical protein
MSGKAQMIVVLIQANPSCSLVLHIILTNRHVPMPSCKTVSRPIISRILARLQILWKASELKLTAESRKAFDIFVCQSNRLPRDGGNAPASNIVCDISSNKQLAPAAMEGKGADLTAHRRDEAHLQETITDMKKLDITNHLKDDLTVSMG